MGFQIIANITATHDSLMLTDAIFIKDNFAGKIQQAQGTGKTLVLRVIIVEADFSSMVAAITTMKNQFTDRLTWQFQMEDTL